MPDVSSPGKKTKDRAVLEALAAAGTEAQMAEIVARRTAEARDELLLQARALDPRPSLRDVAELGKVSHAWVRKLERRGVLR